MADDQLKGSFAGLSSSQLGSVAPGKISPRFSLYIYFDGAHTAFPTPCWIVSLRNLYWRSAWPFSSPSLLQLETFEQTGPGCHYLQALLPAQFLAIHGLRYSSFSAPRGVMYAHIALLCSGYRKFEEWTKEYGPVFSLRQGTTITIVIGRLQAAVDILEKESAHTADRPLSISAGETLSGGMRLLLTPAGDRLKKLRRYAFFPLAGHLHIFSYTVPW
jgi:hypothetical protein